MFSVFKGANCVSLLSHALVYCSYLLRSDLVKRISFSTSSFRASIANKAPLLLLLLPLCEAGFNVAEEVAAMLVRGVGRLHLIHAHVLQGAVRRKKHPHPTRDHSPPSVARYRHLHLAEPVCCQDADLPDVLEPSLALAQLLVVAEAHPRHKAAVEKSLPAERGRGQGRKDGGREQPRSEPRELASRAIASHDRP